MHMALELSSRQAGRVLEHAVRSRAPIEIELRHLAEEITLAGTLDGRERQLLCAKLTSPPEPLGALALVGVFVDVRVQLAGQLYLFASCVLDVSDTPDPTYVMMACPEVILVANRRRCERVSIPTAAQARVLGPDNQPIAHALVADVSVEGLSCALPPPAEDSLFVGDMVRVSFELPGCDRNYELSATVANKALTPDRQLLTLGLEFAPPGTPEQTQGLERLRGELFDLMLNSNQMDG